VQGTDVLVSCGVVGVPYLLAPPKRLGLLDGRHGDDIIFETFSQNQSPLIDTVAMRAAIAYKVSAPRACA
jgi:hypothetical protein